MGKSTTRIGYIDLLRGVGIFLMVMGHVGFGSAFSHFIHAFHMPLFIFLSGFLFNPSEGYTFVKVLKKRARQLLIPYIVYGFAQYLIWLLIYHNSGESLIEPLKNLVWCNTNSPMPIAGALWFLTCLFFIDVFFLIIYRQIKWGGRVVIILACVALGTLIPALTPYRLPWAMDVSLVGLGIYYLGYLTRKHQKLMTAIFDRSVAWWILAACATVVLIFVNGTVNLREGKYAFVPLFWINMFCAVIILMYVSFKYDGAVTKLLKSKMQKGFRKFTTNILEKIRRWFSYIGRNSIVFLCLNQLCILLFRNCWSLLQVEVPLLRAVIILAATMATLTALTYCIMHSKLKYTVGK